MHIDYNPRYRYIMYNSNALLFLLQVRYTCELMVVSYCSVNIFVLVVEICSQGIFSFLKNQVSSFT